MALDWTVREMYQAEWFGWIQENNYGEHKTAVSKKNGSDRSLDRKKSAIKSAQEVLIVLLVW